MKSSKEKLLLELSIILEGKETIKYHTEKIGKIREELYDLTTDEEELTITSRIKNKIQQEALQAWIAAGRKGAVYIATGVGKTKIAIDAMDSYIDGIPKVLVAVPTERLRDIGWKEEFVKWNSPVYDIMKEIETICYASLDGVEGNSYDLVVLDEAHNITPANASLFSKNKTKDILVLTATEPEDMVKRDLIRNLGVKTVYTLDLDQAVMMGIASPYNITIITMPLDNSEKYVKSGRKDAYFYQTELQKYLYLTKMTQNTNSKRERIQRMQFIHKAKYKSLAAISLLETIPEHLKTLIFCSNKRQAIQVCQKRFFSKPSLTPKNKLNPEKVAEHEYLMSGYSGSVDIAEWVEADRGQMSCVEALNEGVNLGKIDIAFIVQLNSKRLHFIQRVGRILRYYRNHTGEIIIMTYENTVDLEWANKAIRGLNLRKIRYVQYQDILSGKEKLLQDKPAAVSAGW
jgi:superfamily II DNA or RNA helicase